MTGILLEKENISPEEDLRQYLQELRSYPLPTLRRSLLLPSVVQMVILMPSALWRFPTCDLW